MTLSIFKRRNKVFYIASCKEKKFVTKLLFICKSVLSWPYQITISRLVIWKNSFSTLNFLLAGWLSCLQINRLEIKEEILNKAPPCISMVTDYKTPIYCRNACNLFHTLHQINLNFVCSGKYSSSFG